MTAIEANFQQLLQVRARLYQAGWQGSYSLCGVMSQMAAAGLLRLEGRAAVLQLDKP